MSDFDPIAKLRAMIAEYHVANADRNEWAMLLAFGGAEKLLPPLLDELEQHRNKWSHIIEAASKILGSDHSDSAVVAAALVWQKQKIEELTKAIAGTRENFTVHSQIGGLPVPSKGREIAESIIGSFVHGGEKYYVTDTIGKNYRGGGTRLPIRTDDAEYIAASTINAVAAAIDFELEKANNAVKHKGGAA